MNKKKKNFFFFQTVAVTVHRNPVKNKRKNGQNNADIKAEAAVLNNCVKIVQWAQNGKPI